MSIIILHLQVPQVCVGLSVRADNHLQDQWRGQVRLMTFLTTFFRTQTGCLPWTPVVERLQQSLEEQQDRELSFHFQIIFEKEERNYNVSIISDARLYALFHRPHHLCL